MFEQITYQELVDEAIRDGISIKAVAKRHCIDPYQLIKMRHKQNALGRKALLPKPKPNPSVPEQLPSNSNHLPFKKPQKADDICQAMIELGNAYYEQNKEVPKSALYLRKFMASAIDSGWEVVDKPDGRKACIKIEGQVITYDAFNKRFKKYLDDKGR